MHRKSWKTVLCGVIAAVQFLWLTPAFAQEFSLRPGESVDLSPVYWIDNCKSLLLGFAGVDLLEGPPGVTLSIREEQVLARRQNCPNKIPGGVVVASVKEIPSPLSGPLKFRVRYNTVDGSRQSNHSVQLFLYP